MFESAPVLSGTGFEGLLASFGPHLFSIKASPPKSDAAFRWRSDIVEGSGFSVWRTRYSDDWSYSCELPEEDLAIAFLGAGTADMMVGSHSAQRTSSTVALVTLPTLRKHKISASDGVYSGVMLRIDARVVARVLTAMFDSASLTKLDLTPLVDLSSDTGRTLFQLAHTIVSGMYEEGCLKRSPKAMALLTEATLRLVFENVPHHLSGGLDQRPPDITPRHIQRAIEYMHANLHLSLTMIDIAEAIGVSERSLQLGFRRFRETTPAMYLRRIRLDAVHAELCLRENQLPVHEVALKWGFAHMGRFAAQYRATFGIYPSQTVKRTLSAG